MHSRSSRYLTGVVIRVSENPVITQQSQLDIGTLVTRLRGGRFPKDVLPSSELVHEGASLLLGRTLHRVCSARRKKADCVHVSNVEIRSKVLSRLLSDGSKVFPYLISIDHRYEEWIQRLDDTIHQYFFERLGDSAIFELRDELANSITEEFGFSHVSDFRPGSIDDWPLSGQRDLFRILGDTESLIGVKLSESFLMYPRKSLSGIMFETEQAFHSCFLCNSRVCESRLGDFDPSLRLEFGLDI